MFSSHEGANIVKTRGSAPRYCVSSIPEPQIPSVPFYSHSLQDWGRSGFDATVKGKKTSNGKYGKKKKDPKSGKTRSGPAATRAEEALAISDKEVLQLVGDTSPEVTEEMLMADVRRFYGALDSVRIGCTLFFV